MQINLSETTLSIAKSQADAAGFSNVNDYIANLIAHQPSGDSDNHLTRTKALEQLRKLRKEVPKLSDNTIVELVHEARAELL